MILLLAGTGEARALATALSGAGIGLTASLAGRTRMPKSLPCATRTGGFKGVEGLAAYLRASGVRAVIDATHPFAAQMSRNAVEACAQLKIPLLRFERPPWRGDWSEYDSAESAAAALPAQARALLAVGRGSAEPFAARADVWYLLRVLEPPSEPFPLPNGEFTVGPPASIEAEIALFQAHGLTHIVTKNAGGEAARAKLDAAKALGLEAVVIRRPALPKVPTASSIEAALTWAKEHE